ncbi:MAG: crossover junction endodeoxyribonuclease RuvC [Alphaproteobacteria bacterium]|nr:MAG: crossover junction endodeoxyribonuclease RuvC [Alphaproteobacteria bacterium]
MKILGLDVGLLKTGWGIIKNHKCIGHGLIKTNPKSPIEQRLALLWSNIMTILQNYSPDHVAIEQTFVGANMSSGIRLGAAYGTIISTAGLLKIPVFPYPTKVIKQHIALKGDASKTDIAEAVCYTLKLDKINQEDTTDALATALCHLKLFIDKTA